MDDWIVNDGPDDVYYRRRAPIGEPLCVRGWMTRTEDSNLVLEAEVPDGSGGLLTGAEARFRRLDDRPGASLDRA